MLPSYGAFQDFIRGGDEPLGNRDDDPLVRVTLLLEARGNELQRWVVARNCECCLPQHVSQRAPPSCGHAATSHRAAVMGALAPSRSSSPPRLPSCDRVPALWQVAWPQKPVRSRE